MLKFVELDDVFYRVDCIEWVCPLDPIDGDKEARYGLQVGFTSSFNHDGDEYYFYDEDSREKALLQIIGMDREDEQMELLRSINLSLVKIAEAQINR